MNIHDYHRFRLSKTPRHVSTALWSLVKHAYDEVLSFRKGAQASHLDLASLLNRRELRDLPITRREELVQYARTERTRRGTNLDRCYASQTSGTSGIAMTVFMSPAEAFYRKALLLRAMLRNVRFSIPFVIVEVGTGEVGLEDRRRRRVLDPAQVVRIPRSLTHEEQLNLLLETRPDVITGHPSCIEVVAEKVRQLPKGFAPRLVVSRGEILHERTRTLFQGTFGCRVVNYYSCDEIGNIAWECPASPDRLHVNTDGCLLEIVNEDGIPCPEGEEGAVLVTNLFNRTMPFIRYHLGDRAAWLRKDRHTCACGHTGQTIALIAGREDDYFRLPNGQKLSPQVVSTAVGAAVRGALSGEFYIGPYQAIQETKEKILVRAVPLKGAPSDLGRRISSAIEALGEGLECRVILVDAIPQEPSGKHRKIVSRIGNL